MKSIIAIFDADGTLYSAQMGRGMMTYAREHGRQKTVRRYMLRLLIPYLGRKLGLSSTETLHLAMIGNMGMLIQGYAIEQGNAIFSWVAQEYLLPTQREEVIARLSSHQEQGHVVVIVSGMLYPCLEKIGVELGVRRLVGTRVEVKGGIYTGRIIPPIIKGSQKVEMICQILDAEGMEIDWDASYAYGDSYSDCDMLELVGNPVAVYPEKKLLRLAVDKGWEIIQNS